MNMKMLVFLGFTVTAALQDLSKKEVRLWVFVLFGGLAIMLNGYLWMASKEDFIWIKHLWSCCLGIGLLLLGKGIGGGIGAGDGLFFLVSGLLLDFGENLWILCGGIFLGGIYGLAIFGWNRIYGKKDMRKETIPFLPFVAIPGIWMAAMKGGGILQYGNLFMEK